MSNEAIPHTPGDWWQHDTEMLTIVSEDGRAIARFDAKRPELVCRANLARTLACVNACKGINPDAVRELLDACKTLTSVIEQLIPEPSARGVADVVLAQARAAIAKAEGAK